MARTRPDRRHGNHHGIFRTLLVAAAVGVVAYGTYRALTGAERLSLRVDISRSDPGRTRDSSSGEGPWDVWDD